MDSMRSLDTSLPKARTRRPTPQPNVHQSFRTAALTLTNFYKTALADVDTSHTEGYQQALEDLLIFMDKQSMGLTSAAESAQVRQWAMEKLDGALPHHANSDSEEEVVEEKRARSSSPPMEPEPHSSPEPLHAEPPAPPERITETESNVPDSLPPDVEMAPPSGDFHFSSAHQYPSNNASDTATQDYNATARRPSSRRATTRASRHLHRTASSNLLALGNGAGHKRRLMHDFFNIPDTSNDRRDGGGGGKRGRTS